MLSGLVWRRCCLAVGVLWPAVRAACSVVAGPTARCEICDGRMMVKIKIVEGPSPGALLMIPNIC